MKEYIYLFLFGLLLFLLVFIVSFNFFDETHVEKISEGMEKARTFKKISETNTTKETSFEEERIGINTRLVIEEIYVKCNHKKEIVTQVDNDMINLSENQFKEKYPGFDLKFFSKEEVKVEERINGICDEHFIIKLGEDFIEVFRLNNKEEEELYLVTNISRDYLASSDIQKLNKGIEVYGKENINSALEDYE